MEVMEDFCFDQSSLFKRRMQVYEKELTKMTDREGDDMQVDPILSGLEGCETKTRHMIEQFNDLMMNRSSDDFVPKTTE